MKSLNGSILYIIKDQIYYGYLLDNTIVIITDILYVFIVYDDVIIVYSALLSVPSVLCRTSDEISPATGASDENIIIMF